MGIDKLKNILRKYHLSPNFTYGQNFLIDETVLEDIVKAAGILSNDQILEIGPGIGNLTERLLKTGAKVFSVEKDPKFLSILRTIKDKYQNFEFVIGDFLPFDLINYTNHLALSTNHYLIVANIPYYITGKILRKLFTVHHKPLRVVLLTQKEVGQNIIAKPGEMNLLAISVQIHGKPEIIRTVKAGSFYPTPKVDSAIIRIETYKKPKYKIKDEQKFFKIAKACFLGKRKQIHNTLENNLGLEKEQVIKILNQLKINPAARPQELSIENWINLTGKIKD